MTILMIRSFRHLWFYCHADECTVLWVWNWKLRSWKPFNLNISLSVTRVGNSTFFAFELLVMAAISNTMRCTDWGCLYVTRKSRVIHKDITTADDTNRSASSLKALKAAAHRFFCLLIAIFFHSGMLNLIQKVSFSLSYILTVKWTMLPTGRLVFIS